MKRLLKPITLWLVALIAMATALLFFESDLLWKVQQHNVFLDTSLFFHQMMTVPGGMLSYLAAFFTQHFFYPWVGVLLLCCWWLLLMWLTKRTFRISDKWTVLTLIPVALLLVANMDLGYWVYIIKLPGFFYVPTIGATVATALLWAYRCLPENRWFRAAFILLVTIVGYPLMGAYALAVVVLMAVLEWRLSCKRSPLASHSVQTVVALLCIVFIPLFYYHFVYSGTNILDIWRTAIPSFAVTESYPGFYIPYLALFVCFLLMAVTYRGVQVERKSSSPIVSYLLPSATFLIIAGCVYFFWYKDANFHHELRMQRCVEKADWEGVIQEGAKQDIEPTRAIVMMHNLALSRLGRQCDEMYNFPKGSKKYNTSLPVFMYNIVGRMMLYQYGCMNECHRVCMEEGVEYGWNVEQLRDMARCAVFNKEKQTAKKFFDLLRHTFYYDDWADSMEALMGNAQQLANDKETGPITRMMHYTDGLNAVEGYVESFIMNSLAQLDSDDPYFQEQAVLASLWTRNPDLFWPRFEHYVELNGDRTVPRIFQEAAWLFANMQGQEGLDEWVLEPGVKESFSNFMRQLQKFKNAPNNGNKRYIYDYYGKTYYFEFFFLKDITYY